MEKEEFTEKARALGMTEDKIKRYLKKDETLRKEHGGEGMLDFFLGWYKELSEVLSGVKIESYPSGREEEVCKMEKADFVKQAREAGMPEEEIKKYINDDENHRKEDGRSLFAAYLRWYKTMIANNIFDDA